MDKGGKGAPRPLVGLSS